MSNSLHSGGTVAPVQLELRHVSQAFPKASGAPLLVLDDISFTLREKEIVGLLGRSGSGKSTLLRIISGLVPPTRGEVLYQGRPVTRPAAGIAMVFQNFALFPWLTVLENVQAGLDALLVPENEARRRALGVIELIGLDGFEGAYPRELSGGMRQRVGFARALVVDPTILLMDEPFSALDVLTAETLRSDFMELWSQGKLAIKSVLLVTHNIEEAVVLCDRILVLSSNPGQITTEIAVPLSHPRIRLEPGFREVVDDIYGLMTAGPAPSVDGRHWPVMTGIGTRLPVISARRIAGLVEVVAAAPFRGHADLPALATRLHLGTDELLRVAEVAKMMGFAELGAGDLALTTAGRTLAEADMPARKQLFADHLLRSVPLAAHIRRVLEERPGHRAPRSRFIAELEDHISSADAERTLSAAIGWGRYADIFAYDHPQRTFSLSSPDWSLSAGNRS